MSWTSFLLNKEMWRNIHAGADDPAGMNIEMMIFSGRSISVRVLCSIEGGNYPKKWSERGFDSFSFELLFDVVQDLKLDGFEFYGAFNLEVKEADRGLAVAMDIGNECHLEFRSKNIDMSNVRAFHG